VKRWLCNLLHISNGKLSCGIEELGACEWMEGSVRLGSDARGDVPCLMLTMKRSLGGFETEERR